MFLSQQVIVTTQANSKVAIMATVMQNQCSSWVGKTSNKVPNLHLLSHPPSTSHQQLSSSTGHIPPYTQLQSHIVKELCVGNLLYTYSRRNGAVLCYNLNINFLFALLAYMLV